VSALGRILICGVGKKPLDHSKVMLDKDQSKADKDYKPSKDRTELSGAQKGVDCREYNGIPAGTHVVSLSTNEASPTDRTSLSHVIAW
jgi:hypothetical protein